MVRGAASHTPRVLFLCTGNSCRSQMAEGFARAMLGDRIEAVSAGTHPSPRGVDPRAVAAMKEVGIDIANHRPKRPPTDERFDMVVTVCDSAHEECPLFPGAARTVHHPFDDPPRLAAQAGSDTEAMPHYRRVRDEIKRFVEALPTALDRPTA